MVILLFPPFDDSGKQVVLTLPDGPSTVFWVAVVACTVVIKPSTISKLSWMTLANGARQLVVQEALETTLWLGS